jgi:hypothetical protein
MVSIEVGQRRVAMEVRLLHTDARVTPGFPVELVVMVDGHVLRVEFEWSTVEHVLGPGPITADAVHDYVAHNRHRIELAITAHLFARGVPLARQIVMSPEDIDNARAAIDRSAAGADPASPGHS